MQVNEVVSFEEIAESIGHGGYGRVFLLRNHTPQAVIKLIDCDEAASAEILRREYETLEKLSHPNVVSYIGLREVQNDLGRKTGILMEYCPRGALRKILLDPRYIYSMNTVFCWIEQLFDAVDYLKRNDTIHRDIKPENIFVTEDFALKLGDFGSNKISEMTCAGTFVGTFRYMSPPQSEEMARSSTMEASHRNDVYSLGLVCWELVERRHAFAEYGITHFDHYRFWIDIYGKVLGNIEEPTCQGTLKELIKNCTTFDATARPIAYEVTVLLKQTRFNDRELRKYDFLPLIDEHQKDLIRPIGFDGTTKLTPIYCLFSDAPSIQFDSNFADSENPETTGALVQAETTLRIKNFTKIDLHVKERDKFMNKFASLNQEEKQRFIESVPGILEKRKELRIVFHSYDDMDVELGSAEKKGGSIEALFEDVLAQDLYMQMHQFHEAFQTLHQLSSLTLEFWQPHRRLAEMIEWLTDIRKTCYTQRVYFRCYMSAHTNEEWLLVGKDDQSFNRSSFIRKDLDMIRTIYGKWVETLTREVFISRDAWRVELKRLKDCEYVNETDESDQGGADLEKIEKYDEFRFLREEPIDIYMLISAMERAMVRLENAIRCQVSNWVPPEMLLPDSPTISKRLALDFPIPGYIFQLRNPPRSVCIHQPKCPTIGELPSFFEKSFNFPEGHQQLFEYECADERLREYIHNFHCFCDTLQRAAGMWAGAASGFSILDEPPQLEGGKNETERILPYYFIFLLIAKGLPVTDPRALIVLLDDPKNYEPGERIPCFDENRFYTISAGSAAEELKRMDAMNSKLFLMADWTRRGWILREDGQVWKPETSS